MGRVRLSEITRELESGGRPAGGGSNSASGILSIGGEHLQADGSFNLETKRYVPDCYFEGMDRGRIEREDILIVKDGATTGKVAFVDSRLLLPAAINEHVFRLSIDKTRAVPLYVFYYLLSPTGNRQILQDFRGATVGGISQDFPKHVEFRLPDLFEQQQTASLLRQADWLRRMRRYALELSGPFLQAVFLELFDDHRLNWETTTLVEVTTDFSYGTSIKCGSDSSLTPVLRIPNIVGGNIDLTDLKFGALSVGEKLKLTLEKGDLLFVRTNGNPDYVGRCSVFDLDHDFCFASYLIRARLNQDLVSPAFLAAFLRTPHGRKSMEPAIRTTAGQYNISIDGLQDVRIIVPPRSLQEKFESLVKQHSTVLVRQREALRQAEHLFQSLLHRTFQGSDGRENSTNSEAQAVDLL
jgi:type I restriction enzyme S subunit